MWSPSSTVHYPGITTSFVLKSLITTDEGRSLVLDATRVTPEIVNIIVQYAGAIIISKIEHTGQSFGLKWITHSTRNPQLTPKTEDTWTARLTTDISNDCGCVFSSLSGTLMSH